MKYHLLTISTLGIVGLGFTSYQVTNAFFTDNAVSATNVLSAATEFPSNETPTPTITPTDTTNDLKIVINEVYYDPDVEHMIGQNPDEANFEWIEIYNHTQTTINLKDWKVIDNSGTERSVSTSNRNILPGQFIVLAKAANVRTIWNIDTDDFIAIGESFGTGLANTGDKVILKNNNGVTVDQISYGSDVSILNPAIIDVSDGHSIERNPTGSDTDSASDFVERQNPTPGN